MDLVTLVVQEYDPAVEFFVTVLGFDLVEDKPTTTGDGRQKRWVVVRPPGAETGLLLASADDADQRAAIGRQTAGRVGFFLRVDDFAEAYARMLKHGVLFVTEPRSEPYGQVAVFLDIAGNPWDLLGPAGSSPLTEPTTEQLIRGASALVPFVTAYNLPLNPENVEEIVYAVLKHAARRSPAEEIAEAVEQQIASEAAAHAAMQESWRRSIDQSNDTT